MDTDKRKGKFLKLQKRYAKELPDKVGEVASTWEKLLTDRENAALWEEIIRLAHNLAGSGTSFGYPEITRIARQLEQLVKSSQQSAEIKGFVSRAQGLIVELESASKHKPQQDTSISGSMPPPQ